MLNFRENLETILNENGSVEEKINMLGELKTTKTDAARIILVNEDEAEDILALEEGAVISNIGNHFTDRNDDNAEMFSPESDYGTERVMFFINDASGYKLQYLDLDLLEEQYLEEMTEEELEEKGMYEKFAAIENDEVYEGIMTLVGSAADMNNEAEIILDNRNQYSVIGVYDERDEVGQITVELEMI